LSQVVVNKKINKNRSEKIPVLEPKKATNPRLVAFLFYIIFQFSQDYISI